MPRIYDSTSSPFDFCLDCWLRENLHDEKKAFERYGNRGDGPDGRGNCFGHNSEHPEYGDDGTYICELCRVRLTDRDN